VTFETNDAGVATVGASAVSNANGIAEVTVASVAAGTCIITARCEGAVTAQGFTVTDPISAVDSVTVTPASFVLNDPDDTQILQATVRDAALNALSGKAVTWGTSNPAVATVGADSGDDNHTATVASVGEGSCTITATCETVEGTSTCTVTVTSGSNFVGWAEKPRVTPSYTFGFPTGGTTHTPANAAALQSLLAAPNTTLKLGDIIELTAGVNYNSGVSQQTFPEVTTQGSGSPAVIYVRTSAHASLPAAGTRVGASDIANMPIFRQQAGGGSPPLRFANRANSYVLVGIYADDGSVSSTSRVVELGAFGGISQVSEFVHDITLDRCYFTAAHLTSGATVRCGAFGANLIITDCWLEQQATGVSNELQAFSATNFTGPGLIDNCKIIATTENIIMGGEGTPAGPDFNPSDITIRRSHFYKDPAWNAVTANSVKNLFELKRGVRVLLEDSVLQNFWGPDQGHAVNLKSVNQGLSSAPQDQGARCDNIVIRNCKFIDIAGGLWKMTRGDVSAGAVQTNSISFVNNLCVGLNTPDFTNDYTDATIGAEDVNKIYIANNTIMVDDGDALGVKPCLTPGTGGDDVDFEFFDNIIQRRFYGIKASGTAEGNASLAAGWGSGVDVRGNLLIGASSSIYPAGNSFPATVAAVGFTDSANRDYSLSGGSPYLTAGKDGGKPGCDIATLNTKIAGAITGDWT